jgi:UDP-N-acetylmuramate--alanine ligase
MSCKNYFFCGIGGSGMMPLALILLGQGHNVHGSDRAYDQGKTPEKFNKLQGLGVKLHPQDGSGLAAGIDTLIVSGAIEDSVPDVAAAKSANIEIRTRAEVLAELFNSYETAISIAGTSGKSTTTGMTASIFEYAGKDPTVMNGGQIRNFEGKKASFSPNMRIGEKSVFITETDESDGSIALYKPSVAVLNNIALDHMPLDRLQELFLNFANSAQNTAILNADNAYLRELAQKMNKKPFLYAIEREADLRAENIKPVQNGVEFTVNGLPVHLKVPGTHNVYNALAALSAAICCDIPLETAIKGLETFTGIKRRMEAVGTKNNITVIDDFGHNPDKIEASLKTLHEVEGRLIIMFQMHGFGPLKLMYDPLMQTFLSNMSAEDILIMPEVYYAGGTADKSVTAKDFIGDLAKNGLNAHWFETRAETWPFITNQAKPGDRIIIMGARDDTLSDFAKDILAAI